MAELKRFSFSIVLLVVCQLLFGQVKVHTIEKKESIEYKVGSKLNLEINTNKADIKIISSAGELIKVTTIYNSKNELKASAEHDLELLKSIVRKSNNTITIHNYVEIISGAPKPTSSLHTTYILEVPKGEETQLKIFNDFGQITLLDLTATSSITSKFCTINISDYQGDLEILSHYDDLGLKSIKGAIVLESSHSDLLLENHFGDFEINSSFSKINLLNVQPRQKSSIEDNHSEITLAQACINCNQILFELERSEFHPHQQLDVSYSLKEESKIIGTLFNANAEAKQIIDIKSNTGIVYINPYSK